MRKEEVARVKMAPHPLIIVCLRDGWVGWVPMRCFAFLSFLPERGIYEHKYLYRKEQGGSVRVVRILTEEEEEE